MVIYTLKLASLLLAVKQSLTGVKFLNLHRNGI